MTQEVDDLADLALRALVPRDVVETRRGTLLVVHLCLRRAEARNPAGELAGRATADPEEEAEQHDERQQPTNDGPETRRGPGTLDGDVVAREVAGQRVVRQRSGNARLVVLFVDEFARDLAVGIDGRRLHLVGVDLRLPGGVAQRGRVAAHAGQEQQERGDTEAGEPQHVEPAGRLPRRRRRGRVGRWSGLRRSRTVDKRRHRPRH